MNIDVSRIQNALQGASQAADDGDYAKAHKNNGTPLQLFFSCSNSCTRKWNSSSDNNNDKITFRCCESTIQRGKIEVRDFRVEP